MSLIYNELSTCFSLHFLPVFLLASRVCQAPRVLLVPKDQQDHRVSQDPLEHQEHQLVDHFALQYICICLL